MKLINAKIDNFGCLSDYSFDFTPGMNCVVADNGTGKTTFSAFLSAMFYGLPATTKQNLSENPRKKYAPWQGGVFGGALTFSVENRRYRAVRTFGKKESEDTFTIYDADTEKPCDDYGKNLGEELFGLSQSAYEKSVFFGDDDGAVLKEKEQPILEKLCHYVESSPDACSFEEALNVLDKQRKIYKMSGNRGKIAEIANALEEAELTALRGEQSRETLKAVRMEQETQTERITALDALEKGLSDEIVHATAYESACALKKQGEELRAEAEAIAKARDDMRASFGVKVPDTETLLRLDSLAESAALARLRAEEARLLPEETEEIRVLTESTSREPTEIPVPKVSFLPAILLYIAVFLVTVASVLLLLFLPSSIIPAVLFAVDAVTFLAAVLLTVAAFQKQKVLFFTVERQRNEEESRRYQQKERLRFLLNRQSELSERSLAYSRDHERFRAEVFRQLAAFGETATDEKSGIQSLRRRMDAYALTVSRAENAALRCQQFESEHPNVFRDDLNAPKLSRAEAETELSRVREEKEEIRRALSRSERDTVPIEAAVLRGEEAAARIPVLQKEKNDAERSFSAIEAAKNYLEKAKEQLSARYLGEMQDLFTRYAARFLPGAPVRAVLDSDLSLSLESGAIRREPAYFSEGMRTVFAFCMRLSLSDALTEENACPCLILDDCFAVLDETKFSAVREFLRDLAETRQILYFTCHPSRAL